MMPGENALEAVPRKPQLVNEAGVDAETWAKAREGLRLFFKRYGEDITRNYAARYLFKLFEVREGLGEDIYSWNYELLETIPLYGPERWSVGRRRGVFKIPRERVVAEVPQHDDWVYRGMSWEEWQDIRRTEHIQSRGSYNLGPGQKGLTLFGERAEQAEFYATGFAPPGFKPSKRRPGVIIAIPYELTVGPAETRHAITEGERAVVGSVSMNVILGVWFAIPVETQAGLVELWWNKWQNKWQEGSASHLDVRYVIMQVFP